MIPFLVAYDALGREVVGTTKRQYFLVRFESKVYRAEHVRSYKASFLYGHLSLIRGNQQPGDFSHRDILRYGFFEEYLPAGGR